MEQITVLRVARHFLRYQVALVVTICSSSRVNMIRVVVGSTLVILTC